MYYTLLFEKHVFCEKVWTKLQYFFFFFEKKPEAILKKEFDSCIFVTIGKHLDQVDRKNIP